jgi:hypothetical protein
MSEPTTQLASAIAQAFGKHLMRDLPMVAASLSAGGEATISCSAHFEQSDGRMQVTLHINSAAPSRPITVGLVVGPDGRLALPSAAPPPPIQQPTQDAFSAFDAQLAPVGPVGRIPYDGLGPDPNPPPPGTPQPVRRTGVLPPRRALADE